MRFKFFPNVQFFDFDHSKPEDEVGDVGKEIKEFVIDVLKIYGISMEQMDTCDVDISRGKEKVLEDYLNKLSRARFAITDRLHGMILCYITNTPCFVFDINNPKIRSTYDTWLTEQNFIKMITQSDFLESLKQFLFYSKLLQV